MNPKIYKMRVVRGAFVDPKALDKLGARTIEIMKDSPWVSIDVINAQIEQIKELQKNMVNHFENQTVPWYMDGYGVEDRDDVIIAFGADDGEGGKIFEFRRDDQKTYEASVNYGMSKGIPASQLDFLEVDF